MRKTALLISVLMSAFATHGARAGIYTDDLSRCMVESTTEGDRTELVKWMFAAASAHPAVGPLANVSADQISTANRTMADLLTRLLTRDCLEQASKAFQFEGAAAISASMQVLGQVAGQQLFSDPSVSQAIADLDAHFDADAVKSALQAK
ncbi:MAG: hypothetical protein ACQGVC_05865 [Myxococcota bacterium]